MSPSGAGCFGRRRWCEARARRLPRIARWFLPASVEAPFWSFSQVQDLGYTSGTAFDYKSSRRWAHPGVPQQQLEGIVADWSIPGAAPAFVLRVPGNPDEAPPGQPEPWPDAQA